MKDDELKSIYKDPSLRREAVRRSHFWFFHVFFPHYIEYETTLFQKEMFLITEDQKNKLAVVMAFRGSGKSTIMNLSYALWSILGIQQKKFVLIVSKTQTQSKMHFLNIRRELENNKLLLGDLGPFEVDDSAWGMSSLVLSQMDAKITAVSREQGIRGLRYGMHRPDLIICDDIEDSVSISSQENRDSIYQWFMSEVIPAGNEKTKIIVLGNLLHADSLLMRLRKNILEKRTNGVFRAYPLLDDDNQILWPERYPNMAEIEKLKQGIPDGLVWEKEYLLKYESESLIVLNEENDKNESSLQILGDYKISVPRSSFYSLCALIEKLDKENRER